MFSHIYKPQCPVAFRFGQSYPIVLSNNLLFDINILCIIMYNLCISLNHAFKMLQLQKLALGNDLCFLKLNLETHISELVDWSEDFYGFLLRSSAVRFTSCGSRQNSSSGPAMKEPCVGSDSAIEEGTHAEMIPHILKQANQVKSLGRISSSEGFPWKLPN